MDSAQHLSSRHISFVGDDDCPDEGDTTELRGGLRFRRQRQITIQKLKPTPDLGTLLLHSVGSFTAVGGRGDRVNAACRLAARSTGQKIPSLSCFALVGWRA